LPLITLIVLAVVMVSAVVIFRKNPKCWGTERLRILCRWHTDEILVITYILDWEI
jgi:hypothetical protein